MPINHYIILGIPADSSLTDIKAAYRRLAKELHPDYYGENHGPFQDLQEAYSVLSDPESRKKHDESLQKNAEKHEVQHAQQAKPVRRYYEENVEPLVPSGYRHSFFRQRPERSFVRSRSPFAGIFDRFFDNFTEYQQPLHTEGEDVAIEITLSPAQARRGGNVHVKVPLRIRCPSCSRHGVIGNFRNYRGYYCSRCGGTGFLSGEKNVELRYPAGVTENDSFRVVLNPSHMQNSYLTATFKIK